MVTFYNWADPDRPRPGFHWVYVYLHGEAEDLNHEVMTVADWEWNAPDLFVADEPMPTEPGRYRATLYGMPLDVFIAYRGFSNPDYLCGRAAEANPNLASWRRASRPEEWR